MIPGPYTIVRCHFPDESTDMPDYRTLKYGYDSAEQAWSALPIVAAEEGIAEEECAVVRIIAREDMSRFFD